MGENSKTSGENGEKLTKEFFELIGWKGAVKGVSVKCCDSKHECKTHGNDYVYIYDNFLHENRTDVVFVSCKNSRDGYPKTTKSLQQLFKKHLNELEKIADCSKFDPDIDKMVQNQEVRKNKNYIGLLIWTHGNSESLHKDIKTELKNIQLNLTSKIPLYFVDMSRFSFIVDALTHLQYENASDEYNFYYPKLGDIISSEDKRYGKKLPIELLVSDLIPIRIKKGENLSLHLYANQDFSEENLKKLCCLALDFADGWVQDISIKFRTYHPANDIQIKDTVLMTFNNNVNIDVSSFNKNSLNLLEKK
ncbi:GapS4a family protein [Snodgrassella communis]|uniref:GapS4a family protein n=1 Tax=Snodgrassella communis TaxID=2946699 RepID=UPI001EF54712|nr:hypothetical protein [Snodgrassella communis]